MAGKLVLGDKEIPLSEETTEKLLSSLKKEKKYKVGSIFETKYGNVMLINDLIKGRFSLLFCSGLYQGQTVGSCESFEGNHWEKISLQKIRKMRSDIFEEIIKVIERK